MKRVYIAENLADAHLVRNRIREHGIACQVFNEFVHGAVGELPFTHTWPEVWIRHDRDESRAIEIISQLSRKTDDTGNVDCPECQQSNPSNFEICWNCNFELFDIS